MYGAKTVSIVLPAYNEEHSIRAAVEDFFSTGVVDEVLVIDNNSRDGTAREARQTRARVIAETAQGYGHALRRGLREATGDFIIMAEPDGTFVARDVLKLLAYADDFDMVCGTRTTRELIWEQANMGWFLRLGNWSVAKMIQLLYDAPSLSDCGCTLRLTRRDALARIQGDLTIGGSHFLPQMVIAALKRGLRIIEVPVNYRGRVGDSKITGTFKGALRTGLRMIALIVGSRFEAARSSHSQGGRGDRGAGSIHRESGEIGETNPIHREIGEIRETNLIHREIGETGETNLIHRESGEIRETNRIHTEAGNIRENK